MKRLLPTIRRRGFWPVALLVGLLLTGCGGDGVPIIPVEGQITLGGGEWPGGGEFYFIPVEPHGKYPARPGRATFDKEGRFRATTVMAGDGLIPGHYIVNIECWQNPPNIDPGAPPAKSYISAALQNGATNGLKFEVSSDSRQPVKVSLDVNRK